MGETPESKREKGGIRKDSDVSFKVSSKLLGTGRDVHVYLPPSYGEKPLKGYPVLYLHDGQNVLSSAGKDAAFGWGSLELDRTVDFLCRKGRMEEIIMVAIDNGPRRLDEYSGRRRPFGEAKRTPFEEYEDFLITELKPRVDRGFRALSGPSNTAVMGSSMGGLCSLVLAWGNPGVFGGAASLSGAFPTYRPNFLDDVLMEYQGPAKPIRVYLDSGVVGPHGSDDGRSRTRRAAAELRRIGWTREKLMVFEDRKILTRSDLEKSDLPPSKWAEAQNSQHNEFYWRKRAWRALTFLFPRK